MAYEQIIAATIDGRWMPTPGDPRDLGRLVLEVPEDGVGIGTVDVDLGHDVERDAVPLPDARFDVARGLGLLVPELVAREREDLEAGRAQLRVQAYHLGVVRVRLASFARDVRDQDDLVA